MAELRSHCSHFLPEFLNRIDDVVLFEPLTLDQITQIVGLQVNDIAKRLAERSITLELTDEVKKHIALSGYDPVYGARPLKRYLQHELETRIDRAIIAGDVAAGSTLRVSVDDEQLKLEIAPSAANA